MVHVGTKPTKHNEQAAHRVHFADARSLHELDDQSVHLVVTSPPYWQLKDYDSRGQIGFHDSYQDYINNLNLVWLECARVLHDGCRMCINIGDQFARSAYYGRYKVIPIRTEIIRFCETIGLDYMGAIIWQKVTTCNTTGGATVMGSFPHPRNGILKLDYEFILVFKKPGKAPAVSPSVKKRSLLTTAEWNTYFAGHWTFPGERQERHLAAFPVELPRRLIRMFTFAGETVLDPFLGSGTTSVAAQELGRSSIGYELNGDFESVIRGRLIDAQELSFSRRSTSQTIDLEGARARLPYVFSDPVRLDTKAELRTKTFGSRIDACTPVREAYHRVAVVHAIDRVELDDGRRIKLAGIKPNGVPKREAVDVLAQLVKGTRVYVRSDDAATASSDGTMTGYLYLANRTFVNARLLREGIAALDETRPCGKIKLLKRAAQSTGPSSRAGSRSSGKSARSSTRALRGRTGRRVPS